MSKIVTETYDDIRREFALVRREFDTVKWMLAINLTLTSLALVELFRP
jgi:hypothetical protein